MNTLLDLQNIISFCLGVFITLIPGLLFNKIFFKHRGARAARKAVNAFYLAEVVKLFSTVILFILVFQWPQLKPLPLFLGFILTQLGYWVILLRLGKKKPP